MIIKYLIKTSIIFCGIVFTISCKKYLNEKPDKSLVEVKTLHDLQGLLDDDFIMNSKTPSLGQNSDGDIYVLSDTYNSFQQLDREAYTWRVGYYNYPNTWADIYNAIYNSNYVIEKISKIPKNDFNKEIWENVKGSALFFRGFNFLNLLWEYAQAYDEVTSQNDLGIVLRLSSDFNIPSVRSNVLDSYEQVIKDLKESSTLLSDHPQHVMRPSKVAAYAALARTYLSMRIYDSAYKYSNAALLLKDDLVDYNSEAAIFSDVPFERYNKETIFYSTQKGDYSSMYSFYGLIDSILYTSYSNHDLRKIGYFFENSPGYSFKGHYTGDMYLFFSGIATDEIYLIFSESASRIGKTEEALFYLNALLSKRYVTGNFEPYSLTDTQQITDLILLERRKELTMRGLRWIDIKRLNKEGRNIILQRYGGNEVFELQPNSNKYALALPNDIIKLTGILQNPK